MGGLVLKILFTLTALSPALFVYGIMKLANSMNTTGIAFCFLSLIGIFAHWVTLKWTLRKLPNIKLSIIEITPSDNKLISYTITYFIPIMEGTILSTKLLTIVFCLLFVVIIFSYASWYNPLHFLFGYHYYDIKDSHSINKTIISKQKLNNTKVPLQVRELGPYQYIKS